MNNLIIHIDQISDIDPMTDIASNLANSLDAGIEIIYTTNYKMKAMMGEAYPRVADELEKDLKKEKSEAEKKLKDTVSLFREKLKKPKEVRYHISEAELLDELKPYSGKDYLVISLAKNGDGFSNMPFLNDHQDKLVNKADIPVLIIPRKYRYKKFDKIVYGISYHEEDIETLEEVVPFASKFGSTLIAVHLNETDDLFEERLKSAGLMALLKEKTDYAQLDVVSVPGMNLIKTIDQFANAIEADLVVMKRKSKSFIEKFFQENPEEEVLANTKTPVLITG